MKFFLALLAIGLAVSVSAIPSSYFTQEELDAHWERFKIDYNRHYSHDAVLEQHRKDIFTQNIDFIVRHNRQGSHSYSVGVNKFADLTVQEFKQFFTSKDPLPLWQLTQKRVIHTNASVVGLPATVDWVKAGKVTPVKNQGVNGNAWAFSSITSIESAYAIKSNILVFMSTQEVSDCCNPYSKGIAASNSIYDEIFECLIKIGGVDRAGGYSPLPGPCRFNPNTVETKLFGYVDIFKGSELSLQNAVALDGPVAVTIDASQQSFMLYTGGVYDEPACSSTVLDHTVAVVGYGSESGADYWQVKNSWGEDWGQNGYILMSRGKSNQCGIATAAAYPLINN